MLEVLSHFQAFVTKCNDSAEIADYMNGEYATDMD